MKISRLIALVTVVWILLSVSALTDAGATDVIELKAASWLPSGHPVVQQVFIPWGQMIEKRTNGRVKFTWFMDASLVKAEQTLTAVKGGVVDIVAPVTVWAFEKQFPAISTMTLPFRVDDEFHGSQIFYEAYQQLKEVRDEFKGMKVLAFQTTGMVNVHMRGTLIKTLVDFKGKRVWSPNKLATEMLNLWGGVPTHVKMADIYMSLQRGTLDGVLFPTPPLSDFRFTDIVNNHTLFSLTLAPQAVAMNEAKWGSLPPDIQKVFDEVILPFSMAIGKKFVEMNTFIMSGLKKRGDNIYFLPPAEKAQWIASVKTVYDDHIAIMNKEGLDGGTIMNKVLSIIEEARQKPYKLDPNWCDGKK